MTDATTTPVAPERRPRRFRRFLIIIGAVAIIAFVLVVIGLFFVPGGVAHLELEYRVPPPGVLASATAPAQTPDGAAVAGAAPAARKELFLTYTVPTDRLQRELASIFPITEGVENMLRIVLSNPRFVPDPDPTFLRLTLDLRAIVGGSRREEFPGTAVVRTQLAFNSGASTVALHHAQLAEFTFSGDAAGVAESLRPVIESELASQMNGYVVFRLPKDAGWWMSNGMTFVRDVVVENGQVVVVIGT